MCGRYRNRLSFDQMQRLAAKAAEVSNAQPNLDIRPTTQQWVIRGLGGESQLTKMRWGLVPYWHGGKALKDFKLTTFNAKAETVATAATFKGPYKNRRCLVVADGWYEWTGPKGSKQRWVFTPKDGEPLTFGGLWERCKTSDAGEIESFTIVTQPAGAVLNAYHDRAPVVIWASDRARWLEPGAPVDDLIGPESAERFNARQIDEGEIRAEASA